MKTLIHSFLFLFVFCIAANSQWALNHTFSSADDLWLLETVNENLVWASINFNADLMGCGIVKTSNGGSSWQEREINSATSITCIHPRSADVAYLGILDGANIGKLIKTTNG